MDATRHSAGKSDCGIGKMINGGFGRTIGADIFQGQISSPAAHIHDPAFGAPEFGNGGMDQIKRTHKIHLNIMSPGIRICQGDSTVCNFEFWSLGFVWNLRFVIWDLSDFIQGEKLLSHQALKDLLIHLLAKQFGDFILAGFAQGRFHVFQHYQRLHF